MATPAKRRKRAKPGSRRNLTPTTLEQLVADPANARRHTERNLAMIAESLDTVGAARSIVIDEAGRVLAGNATREQALAKGLKLRVVDADGKTVVAVRRRGLSSEAKTALALYDNRAAELAEWDPEVLVKLAAAGHDLGAYWQDEEMRRLLEAWPAHGKTHPDAIPEIRPTSIRAGQLFALGEHRLLCGDATDAGVVSRLFSDATPALMVTDPPYGVDYDPAWRTRAGLSAGGQKLGRVLNDDEADWTEVWRLFPGDVAYVWHAGLRSSTVQASLESAKFAPRAQIIWAKDRMAISRGDYHWQHEPCWYAVRAGRRAGRRRNRTETTIWRVKTPDAWMRDGVPVPETTTVWEIPAREDDGHGHGTQKPVECMARPMRNHDASTVFDPFVGSGTSLIAGQLLRRQVFALELNPSYCQVAIDRWEAFTGQKARKLGDVPHTRRRPHTKAARA